MRSVHLSRLSEVAHPAVYRPTPHAGAPLIVEYVPDTVSDQQVARLASARSIPVAHGQRRVVAFESLERRRSRR